MLINPYARALIAADPLYANVVSLLRFQGANNSTTFTDERSHTWTTHGDAKIVYDGTAAAGVAGTFDGTGDYLTTPNSTDYDFGSGNFCVEGVIKPSAIGGDRCIIAKWGGSVFDWFFGVDTNGAPSFYWNGGGSHFPHGTNGTITANVWKHVAAYNLGGTLYFAVNGTVVSAGSFGTVQSTSQSMGVGGDAGGANFFAGKIQGVRVTKGNARYGSSNFTPPRLPFPNS